MFDTSQALDFGNIDWAGFKCPYCKGEFHHPNGVQSTWTLCSKCSRVSCAGGIKRTAAGGVTICPWCGSKRQVLYSVKVGEEAHKSLRGILERRQIGRGAQDTALSGTREKRHLPPAEEEA